MGRNPIIKNPKRQATYFEGILQLRNVDAETIELVLRKFDKNKIGIAKIIDQPEGIDIYSASNKFIRLIARKLSQNYGGEVKESPKLFSRSSLTCKDIFRLTVFYKGPEFKKGQIVHVKNTVFIVSSCEKKYVKGTDLATGQRVTVTNENLVVLKPVKALVVGLKPKIAVMHPETYQSVEVENIRPVHQNQEVDVVIAKHKIYLV
jgi:nonsense-mediated mRNA decay protein 3